MDWLPFGALALTVVGALMHLERRITRIETHLIHIREQLAQH